MLQKPAVEDSHSLLVAILGICKTLAASLRIRHVAAGIPHV
jgi:hypothetical protein